MTLLLLGNSSSSFAVPTTPDSSFTDNGDGTVTHKKTGLTWKRCAEGQIWDGKTCTGTVATYTLSGAAAQIIDVFLSTGKTWRIPNIFELQSLVEHEKYNPAINTTLFPNTPSLHFWSFTKDDASDINGYGYVDFATGIKGISKNCHSCSMNSTKTILQKRDNDIIATES